MNLFFLSFDHAHLDCFFPDLASRQNQPVVADVKDVFRPRKGELAGPEEAKGGKEPKARQLQPRLRRKRHLPPKVNLGTSFLKIVLSGISDKCIHSLKSSIIL